MTHGSDAHVALVTYRGLPGPAADDLALQQALVSRGIRASIVAWDTPRTAWDAFDAVIVRSTWDYHRRLREFFAWLATVESSGVSLWNAAHLLRWNSHKGYLATLEARGVPTVPTRWIRRGTHRQLGELLDEYGFADAVIKPAVSASAQDTYRISRANAAAFQPTLDRLTTVGDVLVQPFLPHIAEGEYSFVFIDSRYHHTILKRPASGDFRVQRRFGGIEELVFPPREWIALAAAALAASASDALFARVDIVADATHNLLVMEVELVEPVLFLNLVPDAAECLAGAIVARVTR